MDTPEVGEYIAQLTDKDYHVRRHVADALGKIGDPSAVPALIGALKDEDSIVRRRAATALSMVGEPVIPALRELFNGRETMRKEIVNILCNIRVVHPAVGHMEPVDQGSFWHGDHWVGPLYGEEEEWVDDTPEIVTHSSSAAATLAALGASAIPTLIEALKDKDKDVRACANEALEHIRDDSAVPALIEALKDENENVCQVAAKALQKIGDSVTLPRKILASANFSAKEKSVVLIQLRNVRYDALNLHYNFPDTRTLCQTVLNEEDAEARNGAQRVLDLELLIPSKFAAPNHAQELVRASQGGTSVSHPETLLRGADEPEETIVAPPPARTWWERLFGKRKDVAK